MPPRKARSTKPIDLASLTAALSGQADSRTWVSMGTVSYETGAVRFDEDLGPLVDVVLQPSKSVITCRVGADVAGKGEGSYFPFVAGDEVLVALPEGSERASPVILCRLNNQADSFPTTVAGQDPKKNAVAFRRQRPPQVFECAGPMIARNSTTGAMVAIDGNGGVTIRDGSANVVQLSADTVTVQSGDAKFLFQFDLSGGRGTLQVGDAILSLASSTAQQQKSALVTPGPLTISTSTQPAAEHVLTTEAMINLFVELLRAAGLAAVCAPGGPFTFAPGALEVAPAVGIPIASVATLDPITAAAIVAAFAAATQKPPATAALGQSNPGIGCCGLKAG
jgi:hypothetical protein